MRERLEKEKGKSKKFPLCLDKQNIQHIKLRCLESMKWRKKFLSKKWLNRD